MYKAKITYILVLNGNRVIIIQISVYNFYVWKNLLYFEYSPLILTGIYFATMVYISNLENKFDANIFMVQVVVKS